LPEYNQREPLSIPGLADYHCHCDYSIDATGSIDEYCIAALRRGLVEICFTTHFDSNPNSLGDADQIRINSELQPSIPENLAPYVEDVRQADDTYHSKGLSVKLGLEFGWYKGCEEGVARLREMYTFDYMLCGIHEVGNACFACRECFEACFSSLSVEEVVDKYTRQVVTAAESGVFDTIAHLDYIKKYGTEFFGPKLEELFAKAAKEQIFPALVKSGTALEVNTSGIRHGIDNYYPSIRIVNEARRAGVEIRHLGSDAHVPWQIGLDFDAAASLVSSSMPAWDED